MAVYTELSADDVVTLFRALHLGEPRAVRGISSGIENTNYFVDTEATTFVLTLFERLSVEELPFYVFLMKHLASKGMPVPDPVADDRGNPLHTVKGRPAVVVNRLPGASITTPSLVQCQAVGETLARLHIAGRDYPGFQPNPRGIEWWHRAAQAVERFLSRSQHEMLMDELEFQQELAQSPLFQALPRGAVHADLFRDNVLFEGERLTGILDFYFAGCDTLLLDLAICLNDWGVEAGTERHDDRRIAALLRGYKTVRPLTPQEEFLMPAMRRAAALRFWLSRLWDFNMPREAALLTPHDPGHFEHMLIELRREAPPIALFQSPIRDMGIS